MKPSDLLYANVRKHLIAPMQKLGFNYSKSQKTFKRRVGDFTQVIYLSSSSWNFEDNCWFSLGFSVESREYGRWYERTWGAPPYGPEIWAAGEWGIPNWPRRPSSISRKKILLTQFLLTNSAEDKAQMIILRKALEGPALEQLDRVSSYEGAAQARLDNSFREYPIACDLFMIAGNTEKAKKTIEDGIKKAAKANISDTAEIIAELVERGTKYFNIEPDQWSRSQSTRWSPGRLIAKLIDRL